MTYTTLVHKTTECSYLIFDTQGVRDGCKICDQYQCKAVNFIGTVRI